MARPPRLAMTVGIAVATAGGALAPRKRPSIPPATTRGRLGVRSGAPVSAISGLPCTPRTGTAAGGPDTAGPSRGRRASGSGGRPSPGGSRRATPRGARAPRGRGPGRRRTGRRPGGRRTGRCSRGGPASPRRGHSARPGRRPWAYWDRRRGWGGAGPGPASGAASTDGAPVRGQGLARPAQPQAGQKVVDGQGPVRAPGAGAPPDAGRLARTAPEAEGLHRAADAEIPCRADVGTPEAASEEPLGRPHPEAAHPDEPLDHARVGQTGEIGRVELPVRDRPG